MNMARVPESCPVVNNDSNGNVVPRCMREVCVVPRPPLDDIH